jgi:hypothetical protein
MLAELKGKYAGVTACGATEEGNPVYSSMAEKESNFEGTIFLAFYICT